MPPLRAFSIFYDDPDAVDTSYVPDPVLTQKAIERTKLKISSIMEEIRWAFKHKQLCPQK